ncbi:hypothetical protein QQP08_020382 [Theobroma cacao]|nr:hypothetical protein QQP08_020382 [Theobroma cacao]
MACCLKEINRPFFPCKFTPHSRTLQETCGIS